MSVSLSTEHQLFMCISESAVAEGCLNVAHRQESISVIAHSLSLTKARLPLEACERFGERHWEDALDLRRSSLQHWCCLL
jgi:hypothetical protein